MLKSRATLLLGGERRGATSPSPQSKGKDQAHCPLNRSGCKFNESMAAAIPTGECLEALELRNPRNGALPEIRSHCSSSSRGKKELLRYACDDGRVCSSSQVQRKEEHNPEELLEIVLHIRSKHPYIQCNLLVSCSRYSRLYPWSRHYTQQKCMCTLVDRLQKQQPIAVIERMNPERDLPCLSVLNATACSGNIPETIHRKLSMKRQKKRFINNIYPEKQ
ncbi:uncharacterized protein LOC112341039 [Selaginella moellendorffii]|uniref:uncharacterized protein LOC112341039 n=1 Tax=Selaginella moellendorffii TaxID=88036 RepID=UPI000D1D09EB|nr:uncharacterized protein LOC112341039 [Selaginella moellendorffii]|eukprot:XP_024516185.1 uncharacterized protein LOC112341039 [Selaginella moellendorffii]